MRKAFLAITSLVLWLAFVDPLRAVELKKESSPPSDILLQNILAWLPANFDLPAGDYSTCNQISFQGTANGNPLRPLRCGAKWRYIFRRVS